MRRLRHLSFALAVSLAISPAGRAAADAGDIVGGIIGGVITGVIINEANKNRPRTTAPRTTTPRSTGVSSTQRAANRETQTALNYFAFPAGTVDGVLGRKYRTAASQYQAFMSFPVTGNLTQFERDILVGAYQRGVAGSFETIQLVNSDPNGSRALLFAQRDAMLGVAPQPTQQAYPGLPLEVSAGVDEIANSSPPTAEQLLQRAGFLQIADLNGDGVNDYILDTAFSGSSFWCSSTSNECRALVYASSPSGHVRNDFLSAAPSADSIECSGSLCRERDGAVLANTQTQIPDATPAGLGVLPVLTEDAQTLSARCAARPASSNRGSRGGALDADAVLMQAFCQARASAIGAGAELANTLPGVTRAQIDSQCAAYAQALKPFAQSVSAMSRDMVISDLAAFVRDSGQNATALATTAKVCLGEGYAADDMDMALGAALLLVVLGEAPYGELPGHHLSQGFGVDAATEMSLPWYLASIDAIRTGAAEVFAISETGRVERIEAAVDQLASGTVSAGRSSNTGGLLPTLVPGD